MYINALYANPYAASSSLRRPARKPPARIALGRNDSRR